MPTFQGFLWIIVQIGALAVVWYLLDWLVTQFGPPIDKVLRILLAIIFVVSVIYALTPILPFK